MIGRKEERKRQEEKKISFPLRIVINQRCEEEFDWRTGCQTLDLYISMYAQLLCALPNQKYLLPG